MSEPMLKIQGVHTFYGSIEALKGVDMEVSAGEIVTLIGANGAGKSTLLMTICGNPQAKFGRIIFEGEDITRVPTFEIVRRGIAQSPEGRRIFGRMTVLENLQMGSVTAQPGSFSRELERVYTLFPRLKERQAQRGGTLSGGEQQMLAIGRALMSQPRLLLLDEPSLGLARKQQHTNRGDLLAGSCGAHRQRPAREVPRQLRDGPLVAARGCAAARQVRLTR